MKRPDKSDFEELEDLYEVVKAESPFDFTPAAVKRAQAIERWNSEKTVEREIARIHRGYGLPRRTRT